LSRRARILDKYPEALFRIPFLLQVFPDARFIWLVRDGNDTIASIEKWSSRHRREASGRKENWWGLDDRKWRTLVTQVCCKTPFFSDKTAELLALDRDLDKAAVEWTVSVQQGLHEQERHGDRILRVHFEQLSREPELNLARIQSFCGLDPDPAVFEFARSKLAPVAKYERAALTPVVQVPFDEVMKSLDSMAKGSSKE
jgi:hypothetical protein